MKKLLLSIYVIAALSSTIITQYAESAHVNITSRVNMVNRNLRSSNLTDHSLLLLIIISAGFGAYLLRDTEMESPTTR